MLGGRAAADAPALAEERFCEEVEDVLGVLVGVVV